MSANDVICGTLLHALSRLGLHSKAEVSIALLGADSDEAQGFSSAAKARDSLSETCQVLGKHGCTHLELMLVGPDMPSTHIGKLAPPLAEFTTESGVHVQISFEHNFFHESTLCKQDFNQLDMVIAYNGGVWGYKSWDPTLAALFIGKFAGTKVVITSYTMEEAEDDYDRMDDYFKEACSGGSNSSQRKLCWHWDCESNPNGSKVQLKRKTTSTKNGGALNTYYPSGHWQCVSTVKVAETIMSICRRCQSQYDRAENSESACKHHPESFCGETAQRWIPPGESDGGAQIHNFYSCCANPDVNSVGCCAAKHESYDDESADSVDWGRRPGMGL
jgi:hypothetical protein